MLFTGGWPTCVPGVCGVCGRDEAKSENKSIINILKLISLLLLFSYILLGVTGTRGVNGFAAGLSTNFLTALDCAAWGSECAASFMGIAECAAADAFESLIELFGVLLFGVDDVGGVLLLEILALTMCWPDVGAGDWYSD